MSVLPAHPVFPHFYSVAPTLAFIIPQAQGGLMLVGAGQNDGGLEVRAPGLPRPMFPICDLGVVPWEREVSGFEELQGGPGSRHRMNLKHN